MSTQIQVCFDQGSGLVYVQPGAELTGSVQVTPQESAMCKALWLSLGWQAEGQGDHDGQEISKISLFRGPLTARQVSIHPFRLTVPRQPWSYRGQLVSIVWAVDVELDVPWSTNPRHRQVFVVRP